MTKTTQNVRRAAQFAVSVAGLTFAAPAIATDETPPSSFDMGHGDLDSPTAASALTSQSGRLASETGNGNRREAADQGRPYASQLQDAYSRVDLGQNPALAALAANIGQLATR